MEVSWNWKKGKRLEWVRGGMYREMQADDIKVVRLTSKCERDTELLIFISYKTRLPMEVITDKDGFAKEHYLEFPFGCVAGGTLGVIVD